ncbi:MAG TPA: hypothetical protein VMV05_08375 [bacterium]|nr:hypothetical protein [bacterium]
MRQPSARSRSRKTMDMSAQSPVSPETLSAPVVEESVPNVFTDIRWAWYLLSTFVPFAGIFIALILYDQDSRDVRRVGRNCLFIGFIIWVAFPVLLILGLVLVGILSAASWVSDALPSAD